MLQAMNTGHDGSLSTVHANSPRDALARLETMVLMAGFDLPLRAIRQQVSSALDLIVQLERLEDGIRRVTSITEVQRMESDVITLQELFTFKIERGRPASGVVVGSLRVDRAAADVPGQVREARRHASGRPLPRRPASRAGGVAERRNEARASARARRARRGRVRPVLALGAAAARRPGLVEAGGVTFPDRVYILTLPAPKALSRSARARSPRTARPVTGLSVVPPGHAPRAATRRSCSRSTRRDSMTGKPIARRDRGRPGVRAPREPASSAIAIVTFNGERRACCSRSRPTQRTIARRSRGDARSSRYGTKIYDALDRRSQLIDDAELGARLDRRCSPTAPNVGSREARARARGARGRRTCACSPSGSRSHAVRRARARSDVAARPAARTSRPSTPARAGARSTPRSARQLSSEYLRQLPLAREPGTQVVVRVRSGGVPGRRDGRVHDTGARTSFRRPPYQPSPVDRVVQSRLTCCSSSRSCSRC